MTGKSFTIALCLFLFLHAGSAFADDPNPACANAEPATERVDNIIYTGVMLDVADDRATEEKSPIHEPLTKLSALDGFSYKRKGDPDGTTEYGLSAQQVQQAFPELVHKVGDDGTLGVSYDGLIAPMIEAIKVLKAENEILKARLDALERQQTGEK
ncbi:MAG: tail fiber domain-containing protein [Candidatus Thiodiazotropha lotti]|nr:tail fiber domain-containing protein [Candidatus Thiodiazotropha lotti]